MTKLTLPEHLMWSIRFALIVLVPVESIPYALESNSHNFPAIPEGNQSQGQSFTDWGMDYHIDYWTFTGSLHASLFLTGFFLGVVFAFATVTDHVLLCPHAGLPIAPP